MQGTISISGAFDTPLVLPMAPMSFEAFCDWVNSPDFPTQSKGWWQYTIDERPAA